MSNRQRTILVTGGAGFVGSHVAETLAADPGNRVISLDNYFAGRRENHVPGVEYREGHTKNIETLVPETPDIVYHLGEYARISTSFDDVALVHDMNIVGTFTVLEFCRRREVGKLVYAASSTKYALEGDGRHQSPYAFSKAVNADLVMDFDRWFGLNYAITYFYNVYGPREQGEGAYATVVARFKTQYLQGKPLTVVQPGSQQRGFTHVKDTVRGLLLAGEKGQGDGYAFGCGKNYTVLELAEMFGVEIEMVDGDPGRQSSHLDLTKAEELGWSATVDVADDIREFVSTHRWGEAAGPGRH